MALIHEFTIIEKEFDINGVESHLDKIGISDDLILYLLDSINWIDTYWNNETINKKGLNYYGYTIIKEDSILKLKQIIISWLNLFSTAPEEFILTGDFLIEKYSYEKILCNRNEIINQLENIKIMCTKALNENNYILHIGI